MEYNKWHMLLYSLFPSLSFCLITSNIVISFYSIRVPGRLYILSMCKTKNNSIFFAKWVSLTSTIDHPTTLNCQYFTFVFPRFTKCIFDRPNHCCHLTHLHPLYCLYFDLAFQKMILTANMRNPSLRVRALLTLALSAIWLVTLDQSYAWCAHSLLLR